MKKGSICALIMCAAIISSLSACSAGDAPDVTSPAETVTSTEKVTAAGQETVTDKVTTAADLFGDDYDPFADDYDPYGGAAALPDTAASSSAKQTENTSKSSSSKKDTGKKDKDDKKDEDKKDKKDTKKSSSGIELGLNAANSWENGSDKFVQLDAVINNTSDGTMSGWTVVIPASKNVSVEQYWNCEVSVKNGKLTCTPVNWNHDIEAGGNGTFGVILKNAGDIDISSAKITSGSLTASGSEDVKMNNNNNNNNNNDNTGNSSAPDPKRRTDFPKPDTNDWLSVKGTSIVDSSGKKVWLTGVNWFGYNTGTNTFDGLWTCDLNSSLDAIADHGFNLLRVPISAELIKNWSEGKYPTANFNQATNSYLVGMNSLEIFDYVVDVCRADGIKIMIDIHSAETDASGHMQPMWYTGKISEKDYLNALGWIAKRYKNDDTIIAYDLKNEPHGKANESPRAKWDSSKDADNWKYTAEKAAAKVLSANPNVLIMVEGIEIYPKDIKKNGHFTSQNMGDYHCTWWGGNLRGVKNDPVDLGKYQNKLVYSPHDYGPTVYKQPWFEGKYTFQSLYKDAWYDNWFYIKDKGIAPLLIGEWGGFMTEPNITWMTYMRKLIKDNKLNHTFWCFNSNSGDTGGLVKDDFTTWDKEKYEFVREVLWQQNGKFVGLDHKIPLGDNGITLTEAKSAY